MTDEIIRRAGRFGNRREQLRHDEIEALRRAWDEGKASGTSGTLDMAAIIREAKAGRAAASEPH